MKKELAKLIKYCEKFGDEKVIEIINEVYSDGAQAEGIIYDTLDRLKLLKNEK